MKNGTDCRDENITLSKERSQIIAKLQNRIGPVPFDGKPTRRQMNRQEQTLIDEEGLYWMVTCIV